MKKLNLLIAALHAGAIALVGSAGVAHAQDAAEVRAYVHALSVGTAEAMSEFLSLYPNSALPGSEIGASIAGGVGEPTAAVGATGGSTPTDHGWRSSDSNARPVDTKNDGDDIY